VVTAAPIWVPFVFIGIGAVLLVAAMFVGRLLRAREPRTWSQDVPREYSREERSRDLRRIGITMLITFVITSTASVTLIVVTGPDGWLTLAVLAIALTLISGSLVSSFVVMRLGRTARTLVDGDLGRMRVIGKVVVRGKDILLSDEDQDAASRYAPLARVLLAYQLANFVLIYVALALMQVNLLTSERTAPFLVVFSIAFLIFIAVGLAVLVPLQVRQMRRASQYAATHRHATTEMPDAGTL
jgi:uncharacterized membrane protein